MKHHLHSSTAGPAPRAIALIGTWLFSVIPISAQTYQLSRTFLNPTPYVQDFFGFSVAGVRGNVLVGAYRDGLPGPEVGAAY